MDVSGARQRTPPPPARSLTMARKAEDGGADASAAPDLTRLKRMFEEARDLTAQARLEAMTDIDYYDSKQWTAEELAALRERRQPGIVINRVKPAVEGLSRGIGGSQTEPPGV